jgi:hypothetical protein
MRRWLRPLVCVALSGTVLVGLCSPVDAGVSKDPKKACASVAAGLGTLGVVLKAHETQKAAEADFRYGLAQALMSAGQNIARAAGSRIPSSAKKAFLAGTSIEAFTDWCQATYPTSWRRAFKAGVASAKEQKP